LILVVNEKVIFIELKTEIGKQGKEQKIFETQVKSLNQIYVIVRTLEEFKEICKKYY
jgi:hypothetical protein